MRTILRFPLDPVPASRPRVTRYRTYYLKKYNDFKLMAAKMLDVGYSAEPHLGPVRVLVEFHREQPGKTKLEHPDGDIDNYQKAIFDACNGVVWIDDRQIIIVGASKRWAPKGETGWMEMIVHSGATATYWAWWDKLWRSFKKGTECVTL